MDQAVTNEWAVGEIPGRIAYPGGEPLDYRFAGWTNGLFGLDFRVYDDDDGEPYVPGWSVTHVPTGYTVCTFLTALAEAKALADELAESADWDFGDPAVSKGLAQAFHIFRERHSDKVRRGTAYFAPTSLERKP